MKKILTFKRVMAAFLVVSMLMSFTPAMAFATQTDTDDTPTFTDVGINHWAYQYVEQAVSLGLFSDAVTTVT